MKLLIAIPALNEEESIESIIERTLAARDSIVSGSPIDEVEITVVSDGSTDRTAELAGNYRGQINLIVFRENRGYGAAIKEAWRRSDADILGFLDADGTCDPAFFAPLCRALAEQNADVVLGCRLNGQSHMPLVRRIGNLVFAGLLAAFSGAAVRDTASGMRVVRRSALAKLFPLPDGLHFTPAMSARAMLSDAVKIVEIDMPYEERAGESKLRVGKDGLRFLRVILESAFLYRPSRPLALLGAGFFLAAAALMIGPSLFYVENRWVQPLMIYRFLVSALLGVGSCLLVCGSYVTERIVRLALPGEIIGRARSSKTRFFRSRWFWVVPAVFAAIGIGLVFSSLVQRFRTGETNAAWSRYVAMTFWLSLSMILSVTRIIDRCLMMMEDRLYYLNYLLPAELQPTRDEAPQPEEGSALALGDRTSRQANTAA